MARPSMLDLFIAADRYPGYDFFSYYALYRYISDVAIPWIDRQAAREYLLHHYGAAQISRSYLERVCMVLDSGILGKPMTTSTWLCNYILSGGTDGSDPCQFSDLLVFIHSFLRRVSFDYNGRPVRPTTIGSNTDLLTVILSHLEAICVAAVVCLNHRPPGLLNTLVLLEYLLLRRRCTLYDLMSFYSYAEVLPELAVLAGFIAGSNTSDPASVIAMLEDYMISHGLLDLPQSDSYWFPALLFAPSGNRISFAVVFDRLVHLCSSKPAMYRTLSRLLSLLAATPDCPLDILEVLGNCQFRAARRVSRLHNPNTPAECLASALTAPIDVASPNLISFYQAATLLHPNFPVEVLHLAPIPSNSMSHRIVLNLLTARARLYGELLPSGYSHDKYEYGGDLIGI